MKVGIISDTHGSAERWNLAYERYLKATDIIIHAGDVLYHGPRNPILTDYNPGKLAESINSCNIPLIMARGNCDAEVDANVLATPLLAPYSYVIIDGLKIAVTHGHTLETPEAKVKFAKQLKADILVTGHTHIAGIAKKSGVILLNPGSPSLTKRDDKAATLAIIDDAAIRIIDIDTDKTIELLKR